MDFAASEKNFAILIAVAAFVIFWAVWTGMTWEAPIEERLRALRTRRVKTRSDDKRAFRIIIRSYSDRRSMRGEPSGHRWTSIAGSQIPAGCATLLLLQGPAARPSFAVQAARPRAPKGGGAVARDTGGAPARGLAETPVCWKRSTPNDAPRLRTCRACCSRGLVA